MVVFKSPMSKRRHARPVYDKGDYIINNSRTKERTFQDVLNVEAITKKGWNYTGFQKFKDEARDITLTPDEVQNRIETHYKHTMKPKSMYNY